MSASFSSRGFFSCSLIFGMVFILYYFQASTVIQKLDERNKKLEGLLVSRQLASVNAGRQIGGSQESINPNNERDLLSNSVIIYNRVPKTASTSFMGLAYDLCKVNNYHVLHLNTTKNSHVMSIDDQRRFVLNVTNWSEMKPSIYHGHVAYIDFAKFGVSSKPIYVNLIRDPLERLVSYYYFLRNGDDFRPHVVRKRKGNKVSFDDCIIKGEHDCDPSNLWLQVPFFCGHSAECWTPGSEWALEEAKRNLVSNYLVVGLTERLQDFVALLEVTLPRYFEGSMELFTKGNKSHLRRTYNKIQLNDETISKMHENEIWKMEMNFYEFAAKQFDFMFKQSFVQDGQQMKPKGSQFFYEKIRPK
ncbi:Heparan sulfate 2-O-sulfotransferase 1 [Halotydeus destructor]|nr:Heparan sulfate 2-O-sulfotransferase 1 [Halotydeus destructor]